MIKTNNDKLKHLIYYSVPTTFDEETIEEILLKIVLGMIYMHLTILLMYFTMLVKM